MLAFFGTTAIVWPVLGRLPWFFVVIGVLMYWQLVRNYRRYRERVHYAIAERDRAGIQPPTHPDRRGED